MEPKRQREATIALVVVLLAVAAYVAYQTLSAGHRPSSTATVASNEVSRLVRRGSTGAPHARGAWPQEAKGATEAPQVHLEALGDDRPEPDPRGRDIFRFREKPPPPPPPPPKPIVGPQLPPPPPPPPP